MYSSLKSRKKNFTIKNIYEYKKLIVPNYLKCFFSKKFYLLIIRLQDINIEINKKNIDKIIVVSTEFLNSFKFRNKYVKISVLEYALINIIQLSIMNIHEKNYCMTYIALKIDNQYDT